MNKAFWIMIILIVAASAYYYYNQKEEIVVTSFEECVAAGNPVMESYPEQCRSDSGETFVRTILPTPNNTEPVPSDETRVRGPENLTLAIGSSGEAAGLDIAVLEIVSDNRCPSDVQCIQAGKVVVKIEVGSGLSKKQEILELPGKSILFDGYEVGLTEVRPVPQTKNPTTIADYRVTILVSPTAEGDNL